MRICEGLVKHLWFAVIAGWTFNAALAGACERAPFAFGPSLALADTGQPESGPQTPERPAMAEASICPLLESAAEAHGLPLDFFAKLIWQESRFNPDLVGPATRSGDRAKGIAQFMPDTAKERGVEDPFNPVAALPKSAEFLRELRTQFGNLGLAAAAYNAGPKRVRKWLAGRSRLPGQTRSYVSAITGRSADDWAASLRRHDDRRHTSAPPRSPSCNELLAQLKAEPVLFMEARDWSVRSADDRPGAGLHAGVARNRVVTRVL